MTATPEQIAHALTAAVDATNQQLMDWASGPANVGPYAQDTYQANVHITAAFRMLECNFKTAVAAIIRSENDGR